MRKCYCRSFAGLVFGLALFIVGLIVVDNPDISYGSSSPDVLIFLGTETGDNSVLFSEEAEENLPSITFEESFDNETSLNDAVNDSENIAESFEFVSDSLELAFENNESALSDSFENSKDNSNSEEPSDESNDVLFYNAEELSENTDVPESDFVTENEIDDLISQVESVSEDLNVILNEASEETIAENTESDEDSSVKSEYSFQNDLDAMSFVEKVETNENVLSTEDSLTDSDLEENKESVLFDHEENDKRENESLIDVEFGETIALPKEIEATLEEAGAFKNDHNDVDSKEESVFEENISNVVDSLSEESRFNDAEQLVSDDSSSEESLNPNALEIEEINREYGWETVESKNDTSNAMGFDANAHTRKIDDRRFNNRYGEEVSSTLSNEFWIVGNNGYDYYFWKYENNIWRNLTSDEFFSTDDPGRTTIIWAHGYQTDMSSATQSGSFLNSLIKRGLENANQNKPYRLVVWKWDSERNMARIRVDAKNKTALANCSGVSLGKFIGRFNSADKVCLIGFSFGAQVVGEALQYLATNPNGYLQNTQSNEETEGVAKSGTLNVVNSGNVSLMLISAACDSNAFNRGGVYAFGSTIPSKVLNVFNPYDYALHYYPFVSNVRSDSFGVQAVANDVFPSAEGRINNLDVSGSVGRKHSFTDEIGSVPTEILLDVLFGN